MPNLLTSVETVDPAFIEQANTWIQSNSPLLIAGAAVVAIGLGVYAVTRKRKPHPSRKFYR